MRSKFRIAAFGLTSLLLLCLAVLAGCGSEDAQVGPALSGVGDVHDGAGGVVGLDAAVATEIAAVEAAGADGVISVDATPAETNADTAVLSDGPAPCPANHCLIAGECLANATKHPKNPCLQCSVAVANTVWTSNDGGKDGQGACDDGDPCSVNDHCTDGKCAGDGKVCDDGNPCTNDACDLAGGCTATVNSHPCDDGSVCSLGDLCKAGSCGPGFAKSCDDGNVCSTDSCDSKLGCQLAHNTTPCDDGNLCSVGDACKAGSCAPGAAKSCDDKDVCTVDACDPKLGCGHKSVANLCVDDNPCTDQGCDAIKGCVFPFNTKPCNDQSLCTTQDTCSKGACLGLAVDPADGNTCTDDSCDPKVGAVHTVNVLPCDDANACTLEDTCGASKCQPGTKPLACDDTNPCTSDSCDPKKACIFVNNTLACDDGDACTSADTCGDSNCVGKTVVCDDGNACTTDSCDKKSGCKQTLIVSNTCRPVIVVDYPPRAATIKSDTAVVTVTGSVKSGAGPITSFVLNGVDVPLGADGKFAYNVAAKPGGNSLIMDAQDKLGSKKRRVQSYLWSKVYFKPDPKVAESGLVDPGLAFWLSQQVIDDGDHSLPPNDLATIFEIYLQALDISALLPNPLYSGSGFTVTSTKLTYDPAKVTLKSAANNILKLNAKISNAVAGLDAKGPLGLKSSGKLKIASIDIVSDVQLSVNKTTHKLVVTPITSTATLNGVTISNFSGIFGFLINLLGPVIVGALKPPLEKSINDALAGQIGPALSSALNALALNTTFSISKLDGSGDKVTLNLVTDFSDVQGDVPGIAFLERGRVTSTKATPYDNLGVPGRIACNKGVQTLVVLKQSPLELVIADDAFNELLHGTWYGGLFEFPVPASMLGNVDLSTYGVSDLTMKVSAMLAPTMDDCNAAGELNAHIGDFKIDAKLKLFGQPMDVILYATFVAGIEIKATGQAIGISLTAVKSQAIQVDVLQDNMVSSEGVLEKLVADQLIGNLVAKLGGDALGSFPLPAIDLSKALPSLPPGTGIAINPQKVTRKDGNSIVGGTLK